MPNLGGGWMTTGLTYTYNPIMYNGMSQAEYDRQMQEMVQRQREYEEARLREVKAAEKVGAEMLDRMLTPEQLRDYRPDGGRKSFVEVAPSGRRWRLMYGMVGLDGDGSSYTGFRTTFCVLPEHCYGATQTLGILMAIRGGQENEILRKAVITSGGGSLTKEELDIRFDGKPWKYCACGCGQPSYAL